VHYGVFNNKSNEYLRGWMQSVGRFPSSRSRCTGSVPSFVSGRVTLRLILNWVDVYLSGEQTLFTPLLVV
jgi:hypothetical protein